MLHFNSFALHAASIKTISIHVTNNFDIDIDISNNDLSARIRVRTETYWHIISEN